MMNILFYTILFVIGIVIGSLWAIKAEEMPKELDMRRTHYSSKAHEELISKLIYILIGGVSSVILANILNINIHEIDLVKPIIYVFAMLYISALVLIAGIDKNYSKIEKRVLAFGIISSIVYMLYLCAVDLTNLNLCATYFAIYMIFLVIDSFMLRRYAKDSYIVNILLVLTMILTFTDLRILIYTVTMALIASSLYAVLIKHQQKKTTNQKIKISQIPVGFFIGASNIIVLFIVRVFENYMI